MKCELLKSQLIYFLILLLLGQTYSNNLHKTNFKKSIATNKSIKELMKVNSNKKYVINR